MKVTNPTKQTFTICATGDKVVGGATVDVDTQLGKQLVAQGWKQSKAKKTAAPQKAAATMKAATKSATPDSSEED